MSARLNASVDGPQRLRAEPERLALVGRQRRSPFDAPLPEKTVRIVTFWPELAQARDQAAAREGDVVGMGSDEDVGHGRPSIPSAPPRPRVTERVERLVREAARADERHEHARAVGRSRASRSPWRIDEDQVLLVARPDRDHEAAAVGRAGRAARSGIAGAAAVTTIPSHGAPAGSPRLPSPTRISTCPRMPSAREALARLARRARRAARWLTSRRAPSQARIAAW